MLAVTRGDGGWQKKINENQSTCLLDLLLLSELYLLFHLRFCLNLSWNVFANCRSKLLFSVLVASLVLCHFSGRMLYLLLLYTTHSQHFCCPYLHTLTYGYLLTAISCLSHAKTSIFLLCLLTNQLLFSTHFLFSSFIFILYTFLWLNCYLYRHLIILQIRLGSL